MYWTTFKTCDSTEYIQDNYVVAVDNLLYSIGNDLYRNYDEPIDIHVLNTNTLEWSLLPDRIDINGERLKPPDVPKKRYGYTVVAYDKKIYLWGGSNKGNGCNTLYCFDTKTLSWSRPKVTGIIPTTRIEHSACISNHLMYVFGGFNFISKEYVERDVLCLDLKTMNWKNIITTGETPSYKQHRPTIVNDRMYIFGECSYRMEYGIKEATDIMYLDLKSNQWHHPETTGNIPVVVVHNNIIYAFGGHIECVLYYFDTKWNHWNSIKPRGKSPKLASEQSCIVIGNKMFFLCFTRLASGDEDTDEGTNEDTDKDADEYRNWVHVLDFNPSLQTLAIMEIIENGLDFSCLPTKLRSEIDSMRQHSAQ